MKKRILFLFVLAFLLASSLAAVELSYETKKAGDVRIEIYNVKGQKITTLITSCHEAGLHSIIWDGRDSQNRMVSSGIYFYKLESSASSILKKMMLLC
jgi:flagellar hook assembly protein FlgD